MTFSLEGGVERTIRYNDHPQPARPYLRSDLRPENFAAVISVAIARAYRGAILMRCDDDPALLAHLFQVPAASWLRDVAPPFGTDSLIFSATPGVILVPQTREAVDGACLIAYVDGVRVARSTPETLYALLQERAHPAQEVLQRMDAVCTIYADYDGFEVEVKHDVDIAAVLHAIQGGIAEFDEISLS